MFDSLGINRVISLIYYFSITKALFPTFYWCLVVYEIQVHYWVKYFRKYLHCYLYYIHSDYWPHLCYCHPIGVSYRLRNDSIISLWISGKRHCHYLYYLYSNFVFVCVTRFRNIITTTSDAFLSRFMHAPSERVFYHYHYPAYYRILVDL